MAILKFDAVAKDASDPKMQQFLATIGKVAPKDEDLREHVATNEQPFLPELAWAYFQAYSTILYSNWIRYKVLTIGLVDAGKYLKSNGVKTVLKAALPHQQEWIDQNEPGVYHYLLDELEGLLLAELRKILEGKEADQQAAARAKAIMDAVKLAGENKADAVAGAAVAGRG